MRFSSIGAFGFLATAPLLLASALAIQACHNARVGPCSGHDCPKLPGCEGEAAVTCDPEHVCVERVCEGVGWICGVEEVVEQGAKTQRFAWYRKSAPCTDSDPCTTGDVCLRGTCQGQPLDCSKPPANTCLDAIRLGYYPDAGSCYQGQCEFTASEIRCSQGCKDGKCIGEPCLGVTCNRPPSSCYKSPGQCTDGNCTYEALAVGSTCKTGDLCKDTGSCDVKGVCQSPSVVCQRPHASGGTCVQGACQGFACDPGWGNCNDDWDDGCETQLNTIQNCGKCARKCSTGAHADPVCSGGSCSIKCIGNYRNCDDNDGNGCEILVGVPNVCSTSGQSGSAPCGTAYCGSKSGNNVKNFGSWYCVWCEQCHHFSNGWSWCLGPAIGGDGNFSDARCDCCTSASADQVCK